MPKARSRLTHAVLCGRIRGWINAQKEEFENKHGVASNAYQEFEDRLVNRFLRIGQLTFLDMENSPKYRLPLEIQIAIVRFMRRRNRLTLQKSRNQNDLQDLYLELGLRRGTRLGSKDASVLPDFLLLLEHKIENCIRAKATKMRPWCRIRKGKEEVTDWDPYTDEWLHANWDGHIEKPSASSSHDHTGDHTWEANSLFHNESWRSPGSSVSTASIDIELLAQDARRREALTPCVLGEQLAQGVEYHDKHSFNTPTLMSPITHTTPYGDDSCEETNSPSHFDHIPTNVLAMRGPWTEVPDSTLMDMMEPAVLVNPLAHAYMPAS